MIIPDMFVRYLPDALYEYVWLKVGTNENRHLVCIVVIDVLFYFNLAAILE